MISFTTRIRRGESVRPLAFPIHFFPPPCSHGYLSCSRARARARSILSRFLARRDVLARVGNKSPFLRTFLHLLANHNARANFYVLSFSRARNPSRARVPRANGRSFVGSAFGAFFKDFPLSHRRVVTRIAGIPRRRSCSRAVYSPCPRAGRVRGGFLQLEEYPKGLSRFTPRAAIILWNIPGLIRISRESRIPGGARRRLNCERSESGGSS